MSRSVRTARGSFGAIAATLFAAASHALGGGAVTVAALIATGVIALPIFVALAGRLGSLWRLATAVIAGQFLYHWSFAALGVASGAGPAAAGGAVAGPHAAHLGVPFFAPELAAAGAAGASMWASHALTAILTVGLLHRGERAALGLARLILRVVPVAPLRAVPVAAAPAIRPLLTHTPLHERLCTLSSISHRGPPAWAAFLPCRRAILSAAHS